MSDRKTRLTITVDPHLSAYAEQLDQATRLADVARTGLDPWDAHAAAIADVAICPILTLNAAKWSDHVAGLDEPLHIIEIAEPGDQRPED
jgi:hypothetical protein